MEKKPIIQTMKQMAIGETTYFPLTQYSSVRTSIYTGLLVERSMGFEWSVKPDLPNKRVIVTRTQ